jgi:hypothetical protein
MKESFLLEFARNGSTIPVTSLDSQHGLTLENETGTWPRGLALGLFPQSAGTKKMVENLRSRMGWPDPVMVLRGPVVEDGRLRYSGIVDDGLPPGTYKLSARLSGVEFQDPEVEFEVKEHGQGLARVLEKPSKKTVTVGAMDTFDDLTQAIVRHPDSALDGQSLQQWLADPSRRGARKACLLNILAKLRSVPNAQPEKCLAGAVESVFFGDIDRVYLRVRADFPDRVEANLPTHEGEPKAGIHQRILHRIGAPPGGGRYAMDSYREGGTNCLQVVAVSPSNGGPHFAEVDIDLGNPFWDLQGLFIHLGELLDPGRTDHVKLRSALAKTTAKEFLYYTAA